MENFRILCFGEALIDFFPAVTGVPLAEIDVFHRHLGGAPANVAVGLARMGVPVGLMTLVGPDEFGKFVRRRLAAEGVDVRSVGTHATAKTGITFVSVAKSGDRSFLFFRHPSADQAIAPGDVNESDITRAHVLHVGSSTLSREPARAATWKAITAARAAGAIVSADPNLRFHLWEDRAQAIVETRKLVGLAHVVKVADDELAPLVDTDDVVEGAHRLRALGPTLVMVTQGARGSYFDHANGQGYVDPVPVTTVDATGAGDAFVAGAWSVMARVLVTGRTLADLDEHALRATCGMGNLLGAQAVTALGATTAVRRPVDSQAD